jgi:uncharacterized integral membrane protein
MQITAKKVKIVGGIILAVLALIVFLQNTEAVETKLLFATVTMPLLLTLVVGFILGLITPIDFVQRARRKRTAPPQE